MKQLMLGNEAVARGLYEAGCGFVSSYPGTPSTEITEYAAKYEDVYAEWAPNEKVALESAFGASLYGVRSFCAMKHVGLNVAADPLFTLSYTGVNAGLVIAVADDPGMHSSQNEQDSRNYAVAAKLPMLEPSDAEESLSFTKLAFEISEAFDTPVLLKMCTRVAHCQSAAELSKPLKAPLKAYAKNAAKFVMTPANARARRPLLEDREKALREFAETKGINRIEEGQERRRGFITSSTCYLYVKEVLGDRYPVLKLGMVNPLPENKIREFADSVGQVIIVEELDDVIERYVKSLGIECRGKELFGKIGELSQNAVRKALSIDLPESYEPLEDIPARPPVMCAGCPHRGIYYVIRKLGLTVFGDIGCYTLGSAPPLNALDTTICMGASVSGLHGFNKANQVMNYRIDYADPMNDNTICVIGDSTFMHSGMTGLANVIYNDSRSTIVILDNSITGMTGHQHNPTTGFNLKGDPAAKIDLESLCRSLGADRVRVVDPYDLKACEEALREELSKDETSVIISRRPCALLKNVKHHGAIAIDPEKCRGCRNCMKAGCPAVSFREGKARIDASLCTGCMVCSQLCGFGAMVERRPSDE